MIKPVLVRGKQEADILLYSLSTCGMCNRVKKLLGNLGVEYKYLDVDLLPGNEKEHAKNEMRKWNPRYAFPTLVINNSTCVIGAEEEQIKKVLGK